MRGDRPIRRHATASRPHGVRSLQERLWRPAPRQRQQDGQDSTQAPTGAAATADAKQGSVAPSAERAAELARLRVKTIERGVVPVVWLLAKAVLVPFFKLYFRQEGTGGRHVPRSGPVLLASNHRSFLDPFVIGALVRRPVYYVAKRELFERRWQAWILGALGAFPIDRGSSDEDAMATAKTILDRGDCVLIFPEGTRVRPGPIGSPRRGVGRLALETGAPVVPVAVIGTEGVRSGWLIRPRKVRIRFGAPLRFPQRDRVLPALAAGATARIWACVSLQWAWLGGATPPPGEVHGASRWRPITGAAGRGTGDWTSQEDRQPGLHSARR